MSVGICNSFGSPSAPRTAAMGASAGKTAKPSGERRHSSALRNCKQPIGSLVFHPSDLRLWNFRNCDLLHHAIAVQCFRFAALPPTLLQAFEDGRGPKVTLICSWRQGQQHMPAVE
eukprot:3835097-Amphidinium_carterae.1